MAQVIDAGFDFCSEYGEQVLCVGEGGGDLAAISLSAELRMLEWLILSLRSSWTNLSDDFLRARSTRQNVSSRDRRHSSGGMFDRSILSLDMSILLL